MTLSKTERLEDADLALRLMMEELGDRAFFNRILGPTDKPPYDKILPTTWQDMEDKHFIKPFLSAGRINRYMLTGWGWLKGLELMGALNATKEEAGKVKAAIRRELGDRTEIKRVSSHSIAEAADVTWDFVHNLLDSDFIQNVFGEIGVKFRRQSSNVYRIEIPVNFGHELL